MKLNWKFITVVILVVLTGVAAYAVVKHLEAPATYTPTPLQSAVLHDLQTTAKMAQQQSQIAQSQFQAALNALAAEADKVKQENKWSPLVTFDPNDLSFKAPVSTPATPVPGVPSTQPSAKPGKK